MRELSAERTIERTLSLLSSEEGLEKLLKVTDVDNQSVSASITACANAFGAS
jgi:hypothetical protein